MAGDVADTVKKKVIEVLFQNVKKGAGGWRNGPLKFPQPRHQTNINIGTRLIDYFFFNIIVHQERVTSE